MKWQTVMWTALAVVVGMIGFQYVSRLFPKITEPPATLKPIL